MAVGGEESLKKPPRLAGGVTGTVVRLRILLRNQVMISRDSL